MMLVLAALAAALSIAPLPIARSAGVPLVRIHKGDQEYVAIVDTGGVTETKARRPADFKTYYQGLPISAALGADYLRAHAVSTGSTAGSARAIPLDVRSAHQTTAAFVQCAIGATRYRMLLDTAALVWNASDAQHRAPQAAIFLSGPAFEELAKAHPQWNVAPSSFQIVNERGKFVIAKTLVAPSVRCGGYSSASRLIVQRADPTTYQALRRTFGENVQGDVSLSAFAAPGVTIDFPRARLVVAG